MIAADGDERLYQQNHCGVYRSTDGGAQWQEITGGLPSDFGFVMTAHPRDPMTVWNIPLTDPEQGRLMPGGAGRGVADARRRRHVDPLAATACRRRTRSWACCARRWPTTSDPVGVYFGTSSGQVYGSADEGRTWRRIADNLPPIWSVEALALD